RSGVGVHGFARGGFVIDRGKRRPGDLAAVERLDFPSDWRIVILTPDIPQRWHGEQEAAAFAALGARASSRMEKLLDDATAPALRAGDLPVFGAALTEYNALAGEAFREYQGGRYADPAIE